MPPMMALKAKTTRSFWSAALPSFSWLAGWLAGHSVLGRAVKASRPEPMPLENLSTLATTKKPPNPEMRKGQQRKGIGPECSQSFLAPATFQIKLGKKIKLAICDGTEQRSYLAATLKLLMLLITPRNGF